jgi:hypothetical protein
MSFVEGEVVLAWSYGKWCRGSYISKGNKKGEHIVEIDGEPRKIINDEIQYFVI